MRNEKFIGILHKIANVVQSQKYEFIVPEMLLWCILSDDKFIEIAKFCNAKIEFIREGVSNYLDSLKRVNDPTDIVATEEYCQTVKRCASLADRQFEEIKLEHILLALLANGRESFGAYILDSNGITKKKLEKFIEVSKKKEVGSFSNYVFDLTEKAKSGKLDPMVGRKKELSRMIQILHKKRASNPILVSLPGVGKTALVEGLAQAIVNGEVPDSLKDKKILSVNIGGMLSGAKFRGEFEERLTKIISQATETEDTILFIDEIHSLIGAGASSQDNSIDAANILKPYLTNGELKVIGATTYEEYKKYILKDKAFARRFKKIDLAEPSQKDTIEILNGLKEKYEKFHSVVYSKEIISKIVSLSAKYIPTQFFPDKAIEVMDEVGSMYSSHLKSGKQILEKDVEEVICSIANLPSITVESDGKECLKTLGEDLKKNLFGQDEIIDKIVYHIKIGKAGLTSSNKPLGVFALCGSTGVGKTELVKQIAKALGSKFLKYDMSEFSEKHSTSKLIGTSPGYIGFDQSGSLTEPVIQNPECVILFDEIEKADPEVYNLLLQVMDEGVLTDGQNRKADFTHSIIFFTSNIGSKEAENAKDSLGFFPESKNEEVLSESLKNRFPPEFRNRFSAIFSFSPLQEKELIKIVEKKIMELNEKLSKNNIEVELTEEAKKFLASLAKEENMGGRPVERLVHTHIAEKLVDLILFENLSHSKVSFSLKKGKLNMKIHKDEKKIQEKEQIASKVGIDFLP